MSTISLKSPKESYCSMVQNDLFPLIIRCELGYCISPTNTMERDMQVVGGICFLPYLECGKIEIVTVRECIQVPARIIFQISGVSCSYRVVERRVTVLWSTVDIPTRA